MSTFQGGTTWDTCLLTLGKGIVLFPGGKKDGFDGALREYSSAVLLG